jgi:RNA polymerase sigma-70 factor (ECF subfamily)
MASKMPHDTIETTRDKEARLASLYEEYYDRIAHYVYVRIGDKSKAEDIASEVFLKALESLRKYEERGLPMQAWLFKIAHNMVVDHLRRATKYKTIPIETVEIKDEGDPQKTAETNIEMERVAIAMQQLTDEQKEVIRLRFFGGLSSREVSGMLNKSDGAVREMQRAALEKLRGLLGESKPGG